MFPTNSPRCAAGAASLILLCASISFGLGLLENSARGQWDELPIDRNQVPNRGAVSRMLTAGTFAGPAEEATFDAFYRKYAFARWSLVANRGGLVAFGKEFRDELLWCGTGEKPPQVHDHLNALALEYLNGLATANGAATGLTDRTDMNFHPATRVNAMLAVGELNQTETFRGRPPVPLPAALKELVRAVANRRQPHAVKVVAMVGTVRHVSLKAIPPGKTRDVVVKVMVGVLAGARLSGEAADEDAWLRGQAAEVLGLLGDVGRNNAAAIALAKVVNDRTLPFSTRCIAADAIGKLHFADGVGLPATPVARALCRLAVDAVDAMDAGSAMDAGPAMETQADKISRDRLKQRLLAVTLGLKALATSPTASPKVASLGRVVGTMIALTDSNSLDTATVMQQIQQAARKLRPVPAKP